MKIIPVIDLLRGQVVRGVAGRRQEYRPIVSQLTESCAALAVARSFRAHFGLAELYLADLDALSASPPDMATYAALRSDGFRLWVDAGIRQMDNARPLVEAGIETIIAGLETIAGPDILEDLCHALSADRIVFSLDLKNSQVLTRSQAWVSLAPMDIAREAIARGICRLLVLDLGRVGMAEGTGTEELCRELLQAYPGIELCAGGGIRNVEDLRRLQECGVQAVLLASALHDGAISVETLARFGSNRV